MVAESEKLSIKFNKKNIYLGKKRKLGQKVIKTM